MKRVLLGGATLWGFTASFAGCYWLASYQDLTSGLGDAGLEEAGAAVDAAQDGGVGDATNVGDGGSVASSFCPVGDAGPHVYCMDFDHVDAAALGLYQSLAVANIVSGVSVSPPSSLWVNLTGPSSGPPSGGAYNVRFPFAPTTTRLEFQIRAVGLDEWLTTLGIALFDGTGTSRTLNVVMSPQGEFQVQEFFSFEDGGTQQDGHSTPPLDGGSTAGAWHHVILSLTVDVPNGNYLSSLTVDDQPLEDGQPLALPWTSGTVTIGVGVTYAGGGGPEFYFDNVRADFGL